MSSSKSPLREENRGARTAAQHPQRHSPRSIAVAVVDARRDWFDVRVVLSQLASSLSLSSGEIINALGRVRRQTGKSIERPRARARSRKGIVNALDHPALPILRKKLTEPEAGITFAEGKLTSSQRDSRRERERRERERTTVGRVSRNLFCRPSARLRCSLEIFSRGKRRWPWIAGTRCSPRIHSHACTYTRAAHLR